MSTTPAALAEPTIVPPSRWVALLALASVGLWAGFFGPIQVLLAQQAEALDSADKEQVLALVTGLGALVSVICNPVAGAFNTLAYSAAKGGVNALTINGACQYGANGIRFNAILPALTLTPMAKRAAADPETLDIVKVRMPVSGGGPLSADDHAQAALFLCSDESKHITGQLLRVDGGWGVN